MDPAHRTWRRTPPSFPHDGRAMNALGAIGFFRPKTHPPKASDFPVRKHPIKRPENRVFQPVSRSCRRNLQLFSFARIGTESHRNPLISVVFRLLLGVFRIHSYYRLVTLDQAAPLAGWDLPEAFITLRRLLEARMGKAGKREYVQVLRLLETFRPEEVEGAVGDALRLGTIGFDAVKHLVLCRTERRPPRLDLDVYPYLPRARVAITSAKSYMSLLSGLRA